MSVAPTSHTSHDSLGTFKYATSVIALLAVALACVALRCVSSYDPFPYWSGDPFLVQSPVLGLTPALAIAADTVCFAASACVLVLCVSGRALQLWVMVGLLAATGGLAWQQFKPIPSDYWDGIVLSRHWLAGFSLAGACVAAGRRESMRRAVMLLMSSTLVGIALLVLAKGLSQVFFEHPQMVKAFRANKEAIIAAQGWDMNSSMARAYVRRLEQPEASGWFGLANIFATLCAAGFAMLLTLLVMMWRANQRTNRSEQQPARTKAMIVLAMCGAGCATGVYLAGSKGGFAAGGLGVLLAGFVFVVQRKGEEQTRSLKVVSGSETVPRSMLHRIAPWIGPGLVSAALLAIVARGLIGERLGELSLLFRWFYMQGAAKIFAAHPMGVGAAGFKDAYMVHKPALSPEDTSFAHSVLIDWIVGLGPVGWVAVLAWILLLRRASKSLVATNCAQDAARIEIDGGEEALLLRNTRSIACFALLLPTAIAAFLERDAATPEAGLTRAIGLAMALGTAWAMHVLMSVRGESATRPGLCGLGPALAAGAVVACVHCQIELSGVMGGSAGWCLGLLGAAAGCVRSGRASASPITTTSTARVRWLIAVMSIAAAVFCMMPALTAWKWERALQSAYEPAALVQDLLSRRAELASGDGRNVDPKTGVHREKLLAKDLTLALNRQVLGGNAEIDAALLELQLVKSRQVQGDLDIAATVAPLHFPTLRASTRLALASARQRESMGRISLTELDTPIAQLVEAESRFAKSVNYWSWLGTMSRERAHSRGSDSNGLKTDLQRTVDAWTRAHALAPHDTMHALKLSDLFAEMGRTDEARRWAALALNANVNMRLDPVRQLTDSEQGRLGSRLK